MPPTTRSRGAAAAVPTEKSRPAEPAARQAAAPAADRSLLPDKPSSSAHQTSPVTSALTPQLAAYRIPKKKTASSNFSDSSSGKDDDVIFLENIAAPAASYGATQVFRMANSFSPPPNGPMRCPLPAILNPGARQPFPAHLRLPGIPQSRLPVLSKPGLRTIRAKPPPTPPAPIIRPPSLSVTPPAPAAPPSGSIGPVETVDLYLKNPQQPDATDGRMKLSLRSTGGKSWKVVKTSAVPVNTVVSAAGAKKASTAQPSAQPPVPRQRFKSVTTPKRKPPTPAKVESAKTTAAKRRRATAASSSGTSTDADSSMSGSTAGTDSRRADSEVSSIESPSPAPTPVPVSPGIGPHFTPIQKEALADHFKNDEGAAERYTELKEWAVFEASKLLGSGSVRSQLRAMVTGQLDAVEGDNLSIADLDAMRDVVKSRAGELQLDDFKRQLCQHIIRLRDPAYSVYRKPPPDGTTPDGRNDPQ